MKSFFEQPHRRMSQRTIVLAIVPLLLAIVVNGYQTGAPPEACRDMLPQHGVPEQNTTLPYNVAVNKPMIKAGDTITITIKGAAKKFKGFLAQVRVGETPVGKFLPSAGAKIVDCGPGQQNAVTHSKPDPKPSITLQWVAPPELSAQAFVYVTVAEDGGKYWVKRRTVSVKIIK